MIRKGMDVLNLFPIFQMILRPLRLLNDAFRKWLTIWYMPWGNNLSDRRVNPKSIIDNTFYNFYDIFLRKKHIASYLFPE